VGTPFKDVVGNVPGPGAAYVFATGAPPSAPLAAPVASPAGLMAAVGALLALGLRLLRRGREGSATE
jgi:hypothetical protein